MEVVGLWANSYSEPPTPVRQSHRRRRPPLYPSIPRTSGIHHPISQVQDLFSPRYLHRVAHDTPSICLAYRTYFFLLSLYPRALAVDKVVVAAVDLCARLSCLCLCESVGDSV